MGLQIYKRGQGKNTRLWSALTAAAIGGIGCLQLYKKLEGTDLNETEGNQDTMQAVDELEAGQGGEVESVEQLLRILNPEDKDV